MSSKLESKVCMYIQLFTHMNTNAALYTKGS